MTTRKIVFGSLAGLGLLLCSAVLVLAIRVVVFVHAVAPNTGVGDLIRLIHRDPDATLAADSNLGRINFLLLGYGGVGHNGPYLTDSMMLVCAQTDTHQLAMVSIPRDLWIAIPTNRFGLTWTTKINGAYTIGIRDDLFPSKDPAYRGPLGGGNLSAEMVHRVSGQPIQYWVAMDFEGFRRVVDAVGGVDIVVPRALDDRQYPLGETNGYTHVHFNAGLQHMNGARALEFARLRHTEGGDFDRSGRQQLILIAVRQKVLSSGGLSKILPLMDALQAHFRTNMPLSRIPLFYDLMTRLQIGHPVRVSVDTTNFLHGASSSDGQDILLPYDRTYEALHRYIAQVIVDPAVLGEKAPVRILRGTYASSGGRNPADLWTQLISWVGLVTVPPGEAASHAHRQSEVHDYSHGAALATASYLAKLFDARVITENGPPPPGASIVVILG